MTENPFLSTTQKHYVMSAQKTQRAHKQYLLEYFFDI